MMSRALVPSHSGLPAILLWGRLMFMLCYVHRRPIFHKWPPHTSLMEILFDLISYGLTSLFFWSSGCVLKYTGIHNNCFFFYFFFLCDIFQAHFVLISVVFVSARVFWGSYIVNIVQLQWEFPLRKIDHLMVLFYPGNHRFTETVIPWMNKANTVAINDFAMQILHYISYKKIQYEMRERCHWFFFELWKKHLTLLYLCINMSLA